MPIRPRSLCPLVVLILAVPLAAHGKDDFRHWDVTFALRLTGGTGKGTGVRLALPREEADCRVTGIEVRARGLDATVEREGPEPHVLLRGKLKGARRVAVRYRVATRPVVATPPAVVPLDIPSPELLPALTPSPILQSRSILVREFLERHVAPVVASRDADLLQPIWQQTRQRLAWDPRGKTLTLDVVRRGGGQRIGIERAFATFLRAAGIPARLVEGVDLKSSTRRKRVFWTEAWSEGRWWPVSASRGWIGRRPASYVPLSTDGGRVLSVKPPLEASYTVEATRLEAAP